MIINILAGGPLEQLPILSDYDGLWIGVDRGVFTLISKGIQPDIAFGDFDSVTEEELGFIKSKVDKVNIFNPEKDEPDMELALKWALEQNPEKIRVFGGTGGRLDHFFANIQLLLNPILKKNSCTVEIIDNQNIIYAKGPGKHSIQKNKQKKYISFIPISSHVENLTLIGFKYSLKDRHIPLSSTLCISNELINDYGTFSFTEGILLVIRSSD